MSDWQEKLKKEREARHMKKRVLSIALAIALLLQMMPFPMKGKTSGFFRVSKAAGTSHVTTAKSQDVKFSFVTKEANPMESADMFCELFVDKDNLLSGTVETYVVWSSEAASDVSVITTVKDEKGNVIAEQLEKKILKVGMQKVNVVFDKVKAALDGLSGEFKAVCEMRIVDLEGNEIRISQPGITVAWEGQPTPTSLPTVAPTPISTPDATETPAPTPEVTETPAPTPEATETPAPTPEVTETPVPIPEVTETPVPTPEVTETPIPTPDIPVLPVRTETPKPSPTKTPAAEQSSLPNTGKVLTSGSLKYIVTKSSKQNGTVSVYDTKKDNLKKIVIPNTVKVNGYSFKVTKIRKNAFANRNKLTEVEIGKNVEIIGRNAFKNCKNLEFVIIGKNVTKIKAQAFAGCTKLIRMLVKSDKINSVGANAFKGVTSKAIVKTSASKWRKYIGMFMDTGKMSQNALFVINPVMLKYKNREY